MNLETEWAGILDDEKRELAWAYEMEMRRCVIIVIAADLVSKVKEPALVDAVIDECYIQHGWRPGELEVKEALWL